MKEDLENNNHKVNAAQKLRNEARAWISLSGFLLTIALAIAIAWITGGLQTLLSQITLAMTTTGVILTAIVGWRFRFQAQNQLKKSSTSSEPIHQLNAPQILDLEDLFSRKPWSKRQRVVVVTGYFDILHAGHVEFLSACKQNPQEVLVVGVHSDELTRKIKGHDRPILNVRDRIVAIQGLKMVDYVFETSFFYDDPPYRILRSVDPDFVVFSREYDEHPKKTELVEFIENLAKDSDGKPTIRYVPIQRPDIHTNLIVKKIREEGHINLQQDRKRWLHYIEFTLKDIAESGGVDVPTSAIFTYQGKIIGTGHNSRPNYATSEEVIHTNSDTDEFRNKAPRPLHAEINALLDVINSQEPVEFAECEVYCLTAPCSACAETLSALRISKVYYLKEFVNNFGLLVLKQHNIQCEKLISGRL